ncbi:uncharacterized protein LACBIDRAFT_327949 [Laccaria bicolor S238N-H82]|uniref:Predicted protein n=1 Tax=Laccaria bicolor (strain S238N-H82 / ATCC MYA-4686) TaxID=486041 RepID=B0DDB9_LACBS|nr:uncharacterized protein LACBIDRAFT_327949 [Laccaria bicolor S238N-H82]EDR07443.1 predicted protein [Laccaria bicolor S238N-H82]|eukprot:XP_001881835.1 predicted protein [Laccaria bicolor S238N-H82]
MAIIASTPPQEIGAASKFLFLISNVCGLVMIVGKRFEYSLERGVSTAARLFSPISVTAWARFWSRLTTHWVLLLRPVRWEFCNASVKPMTLNSIISGLCSPACVVHRSDMSIFASGSETRRERKPKSPSPSTTRSTLIYVQDTLPLFCTTIHGAPNDFQCKTLSLQFKSYPRHPYRFTSTPAYWQAMYSPPTTLVLRDADKPFTAAVHPTVLSLTIYLDLDPHRPIVVFPTHRPSPFSLSPIPDIYIVSRLLPRKQCIPLPQLSFRDADKPFAAAVHPTVPSLPVTIYFDLDPHRPIIVFPTHNNYDASITAAVDRRPVTRDRPVENLVSTTSQIRRDKPKIWANLRPFNAAGHEKFRHLS